MARLTEIIQIGIATSDLEKRIENFARVGIGPFSIVADTQKGLGAPAANTRYFGEPTDIDVRVAVCSLNGLEIELVQPMDDKGSYAEQIHADFYAKDAKQTVDIASKVYGA